MRSRTARAAELANEARLLAVAATVISDAAVDESQLAGRALATAAAIIELSAVALDDPREPPPVELLELLREVPVSRLQEVRRALPT